MKQIKGFKWLIGSLFFLLGSLFLAIQLYKKTDYIDDFVENTVTTLGIGKSLVTEKKQRKEEEKKQKEEFKSLITADSIVALPTIDSSQILLAKEEEKRKELEILSKKVSQSMDDALITSKLKSVDDTPKEIAKVDVKEETEDPFDGLVVAKQTSNTSEPSGNSKSTKLFTATAIGHNVIENNKSIHFRLTEDVTVSGQDLSANKILEAKINVFDGRTYLKVVGLKAEVYDTEEKSRGLDISSFYKNSKGELILSDGKELTFIY